MTDKEELKEEMKRRCLSLLRGRRRGDRGRKLDVVSYQVDLGNNWTLEKYDRSRAAHDLVGDRLIEIYVVSEINDVTVFDMIDTSGAGEFVVLEFDYGSCKGHVLPLMRRMMVLDDLSEVSDA